MVILLNYFTIYADIKSSNIHHKARIAEKVAWRHFIQAGNYSGSSRQIFCGDGLFYSHGQ